MYRREKSWNSKSPHRKNLRGKKFLLLSIFQDFMSVLNMGPIWDQGKKKNKNERF